MTTRTAAPIRPVSTSTRWRVRQRTSGLVEPVSLSAYWEVDCDPISDDYTPAEISAADLMAQWVRQYGERWKHGLIPIYWFVMSGRNDPFGIFDYMPFQHDHLPQYRPEDFLAFYDWPVEPVTGARLNWFTLTVIDKHWTLRQGDKGGFIQEATGSTVSKWPKSWFYKPSCANGDQ